MRCRPCPQVLLAAAGSEDREVALAACCMEALAPAPAAFRAQLLGALLAHADKGVRVRRAALLLPSSGHLVQLGGLLRVDQPPARCSSQAPCWRWCLQVAAMELLAGSGPELLSLQQGLPLVEQLLARAERLEEQHKQQQLQQQQQQGGGGNGSGASSAQAQEAARCRDAAARFLQGVVAPQAGRQQADAGTATLDGMELEQFFSLAELCISDTGGAI